MASEVCRRTPQEVKQALDRGERLLILDVRQPGDYESSAMTIRGSRRIAPNELTSMIGNLPKNVPIVAVCA